jgi:hypothetical protein
MRDFGREETVPCEAVGVEVGMEMLVGGERKAVGDFSW